MTALTILTIGGNLRFSNRLYADHTLTAAVAKTVGAPKSTAKRARAEATKD
jgi:hypothetical protein